MSRTSPLPPVTDRLFPPCSTVRSLSHLGLPDFPLADRIATLLQQPAPDGWSPSGLGRDLYLDLAERVVPTARTWQDKNGAIIDPIENREHGQTSPRYAAAGAVLLAFGRVPELEESVVHAMTWSCQRLAEREAASSDFWMRELATAYACLAPLTDETTRRQWASLLTAVDPEQTYSQVKPDGVDLDKLHNWTVYAAAGESMRDHLGLCPDRPEMVCGDPFFDKYMPAQLGHFTAHGMYRDPGDPFTYDMTTRLQFAAALAFGYAGPVADDLNELLRRGGLTQLLYLSPEGHVPFGGRSSQFHFQEAIISALCELEARRYRATDPRLAGAFKRQAHLSALSVGRWLNDMEPLRHIKNGFDPKLSFGFDPYGVYSVYSLLAASFFGLAALFADDDIPEAPCPAEGGHFVLELPDAFHKVFATCGDTQVEIDTRADFHHDATGLGRFCRRGVPIELGPGMPFTHSPAYRLPKKSHRPSRPAAIGPEWRVGGQWHRLAALSDGLTANLSVLETSGIRVAFTLTYTHAESQTSVVERVELREGRLHIQWTVGRASDPIEAVRAIVPLLVTDGTEDSRIELRPGQTSVAYRGASLAITFDAALKTDLPPEHIANRNGLYRTLVIEKPGHDIAVDSALTPCPQAAVPPSSL